MGASCTSVASFLRAFLRAFWGPRRPVPWPAPQLTSADRRPPHRRLGETALPRWWSTAWAPRARCWRRSCTRFGGCGGRQRGRRRGSRRRIGGLPAAAAERRAADGVGAPRGRLVHVRVVVFARVFERVLGAVATGIAACAAAHGGGSAASPSPLRSGGTSKALQHCVGAPCAFVASFLRAFLRAFWGPRRPVPRPVPRLASAERRSQRASSRATLMCGRICRVDARLLGSGFYELLLWGVWRLSFLVRSIFPLPAHAAKRKTWPRD